MITFLSLFLGLVTGVHTVELAVSDAVAEVEVRLDGEAVGVLREAPWRLDCDFGGALTPHSLVAVARDARGVEVDRAEQLLNSPRAQVESRLLLEGWQGGVPRSARLIWRAVQPVEPTEVRVVLDGRLLADRYAERYELPELDPDTIHFLRASLGFGEDLATSAAAVFGGVYGSSTESELTAVPVVVEGAATRRHRPFAGRLEEGGRALRGPPAGTHSPTAVPAIGRCSAARRGCGRQDNGGRPEPGCGSQRGVPAQEGPRQGVADSPQRPSRSTTSARSPAMRRTARWATEAAPARLPQAERSAAATRDYGVVDRSDESGWWVPGPSIANVREVQ